MQELLTFQTLDPVAIPDRHLTPIGLAATDREAPLVALEGAELAFTRRGWFEVLLTVEWDTSSSEGHRFAHTAIPDHHPLHSEAIQAAVLNQLSGGRQLLRGNTIFDPDDGAAALRLEVWQNSGAPLAVRSANLRLRELRTPAA